MKKISAPRFNLPKTFINFIFLSSLMFTSSIFANEVRIIGGTTVQENAYPWMASLHYKGPNGPFCGGSLIHNEWILTAAHCVTSENASNLQVTLNEHDITRNDGGEIVRNISEIIIHKDYDNNSLKNDIALLKLSSPIPSSSIKPISLATDISQLSTQQNLKVLGWGTTFYNFITNTASNPSATLREVDVSFISQTSCKRTFANVDESQVCAGDFLKDSCSGDSGGPLIINESNEWVQVGIVSFGDGCGMANSPGVYASVAYYTQNNSTEKSLSSNSWILQTIRDNASENGQTFSANSISTMAVTRDASSSPLKQNIVATEPSAPTVAATNNSSATATQKSSSGGSSNILFILLLTALLTIKFRRH